MNLSLKTLGPDPGDSKALTTDFICIIKKLLFLSYQYYIQWNLFIKETSPFKQSKEKLDTIFV